MNLEQYIGCVIMYNGKMAIITKTRSNYDGDFFYLKYIDSETEFSVNIFEDDLMEALPDPEYGLIKRKEEEIVFLYNDTEYRIASHPYEPCTYIKEEGQIVRTLHNGFEVYELPERFAQKETLLGIDGKRYDQETFYKVLVAAIYSNRSEMDFTFAAKLAQTVEEI